jgi:hypothetical protein
VDPTPLRRLSARLKLVLRRKHHEHVQPEDLQQRNEGITDVEGGSGTRRHLRESYWPPLRLLNQLRQASQGQSWYGESQLLRALPVDVAHAPGTRAKIKIDPNPCCSVNTRHRTCFARG